MITAVDTSVLLDILAADPTFGRASRQALIDSSAVGSVIACDVVWAETAAAFFGSEAAPDAMRALGVDFIALDVACALKAGDVWREYHDRGGRRDRVIADFIVAAHAMTFADRLLTRDRGFYRSYFKELTIIDPAG